MNKLNLLSRRVSRAYWFTQVTSLCAILVGGFGIHKFILGYTTEGIIQIVITFITCGVGHIIGLIEGIIYLTKSDEEFVRTYIQNKKGWF